jgi:type IV pilus biogenesis protein CpaD/CtpE
MNTRNLYSAVLVTLSLGLGACAADPTLTETNFGDSVRQMIQVQTYDPSTLTTPSTDTVDSSDGQRLENVLEAYRTDVAAPAAVNEPVVINVGQ